MTKVVVNKCEFDVKVAVSVTRTFVVEVGWVPLAYEVPPGAVLQLVTYVTSSSVLDAEGAYVVV